ncbi:hypothetical protein Pelo_6098 [Pelomyxa schiedti]|nr:hypothetical protein Pelo_6098 [Pelomyxa schiedti]
MINKRKEGYGNHKSKTDASTGSEDARGGAEMTTGKTAAEAFGGSGTTCEYQRRYASNGDVVERWSHSGVNCGACARPLFSACAKDASEEELG